MSMGCNVHADAILEHALGEPASAELQAHLRECDPCRAALEREQQLVGRIDGELSEALAVTPSPALLPRVRQAVRTPTAQSAWSWPRLLPIAAGLAAVATLLVLRGRPEAVPSEQPATPAIAVARPPDPPSPSLAVPTPVPGRVVRPATVRQKPLQPEVLVPPGEAELVARYAAAVRAQRIEAPPAGVEDARSQELVVPLLQQIVPLEVKSLADVNPEGVDHE
jgi:hypothetical protein